METMSLRNEIEKYRTCNECGVEQPIANYSLLRGKPKYRCKSCIASYAREYYLKNRDRVNARTNRYRLDNWERIKKTTKERLMTSKYRVKRAATSAVNNAIKSGKFQKEPCWCGEAKSQFHHSEGYEKENWFVGTWLCSKHHGEVHRQLNACLQEIRSKME